MNKFYGRTVRRYVVAVIMLVLSGYITMFIKDSIDAQNPDISLPIINITIGYTQIPNSPRAGYEWTFGSKTIRSPYVSSIDVPLGNAYRVTPDTPILIGFTTPHTQLTLYESEGVMYDGRVIAAEPFVEKKYNNKTPKTEGIYVYKVVTKFDRGNIVHYFAVDVNSLYASI